MREKKEGRIGSNTRREATRREEERSARRSHRQVKTIGQGPKEVESKEQTNVGGAELKVRNWKGLL